MIEFKAECGHTVRARDDDAGGVVRCSYCGKESAVPEERRDALDFLLQDVVTAEEPAEPRKRRRKKSRAMIPPRRPGKPIDPFAVVLKMCYAALLIAVSVVVGVKFVLPAFRGGASPSVERHGEDSGVRPDRRDRTEVSKSSRLGLIDRDLLKGMYIASTPPGATAYYIESGRAPSSGRIVGSPKGVNELSLTGGSPGARVSEGTYIVDVVFPHNDRALTSFEGYREFRHRIENGSAEDRSRAVREYFLPDEAAEVFVENIDDKILIVRQYREVTVRGGQSGGVRALFLPKLLKSDGKSYDIERISHRYLPSEKSYRFDEAHLQSELDFYEVDSTDRPFVMDALSRIGVLPHAAANGQIRLLKISINDGSFTARVLAGAGS